MNHSYRIAAVGACLAACAGMSAHARADETPSAAGTSVTLYGILDTGLEYLDNAASSKGTTHSVTRLSSGNMSGSRWGITGREDLGGGTRAFFLLESGINIDTGASLQGGREFGRLAYVGIADERLGTVSLGRQGGLFLDWVSEYNPLKNAVYAIKMQDPAFSDRLDNTVRYEKRFGGLTAIAQYSFGYDSVTYGAQPAGDTRYARVIEAGLRYKHGPFSATLVYDQKNGGSTSATAAHTTKAGGYEGDMDRRIGVAASYKFSSVTTYAGYRYLDSHAVHLSTLSSSPVEASSLYWLGSTWYAQPDLAFSGTAMYQNFYGNSRDPWSFQVDADYFLSKRTDLYLNLGYVLNRNGSNLGLNGFGTDVVAGKNQFGLMAGIRHKF
ncbi:porin [Burkholderia gladioli]|uniref:porin n=1 Tax=Burkholderia gladioli TaxID=28095 RepID=UPI0015615FA9|nr:porin [Burkholderia gladioli]MBU9322608.1 porin [Burkholderia gladioli]MBU9641706.1 porin [Burkholderia gladioli]MDN7598565.1 porin [Burkholderia gladioli]NRF82300.1 porin [Burkholderia gladioli]